MCGSSHALFGSLMWRQGASFHHRPLILALDYRVDGVQDLRLQGVMTRLQEFS